MEINYREDLVLARSYSECLARSEVFTGLGDVDIIIAYAFFILVLDLVNRQDGLVVIPNK